MGTLKDGAAAFAPFGEESPVEGWICWFVYSVGKSYILKHCKCLTISV